jgi:1-deoxy-D-xylulose-5-phosphate reductoisomerase
MEPDLQRFPCLSLAFQAGKQGGTAPVILNAANEIAVAAFLDNALRYLQISEVVERVLNTITPSTPSSLEDVLEVDARSRVLATDAIQRLRS